MSMTKVVLTVFLRRRPFSRVPVQKTQSREKGYRGWRNYTQIWNSGCLKSEANEEHRTVQQQPPGTIGSVMPESIKMDLQKVRWGGTDWIDLAQDRAKCRALVKAVVIRRV